VRSCEGATRRQAGSERTHKNQSGRSLTAASEMLGKNSLVTKFSACSVRAKKPTPSVCLPLRGCGSDLMFVISAGADMATCCSNYLLIRAKCPWLSTRRVCLFCFCLPISMCVRESECGKVRVRPLSALLRPFRGRMRARLFLIFISNDRRRRCFDCNVT
jgi:hypothetical protein